MTEEELSQHEKDVKKWDKDHLYCRNYLLNCLSDDLYDYYDQAYKSAKKIWKTLNQYSSYLPWELQLYGESVMRIATLYLELNI